VEEVEDAVGEDEEAVAIADLTGDTKCGVYAETRICHVRSRLTPARGRPKVPS
jgi:sorbitol-specific phosphotransferase system component IIBC